MAERGRPILVWLIFIFVMFCTAAWLFSMLAVLSGTIPLDPQAQAAADAITAADYVVGFFQMAVYMAAAIALLMMRKAALYLFVAALCLEFGILVWGLLDVSQAAPGDNMGMIFGVIGLGIAFAICLYTLKLTLSERLA